MLNHNNQSKERKMFIKPLTDGTVEGEKIFQFVAIGENLFLLNRFNKLDYNLNIYEIVFGLTPLHIAVFYGRLSFVDVLLASKTLDINMKTTCIVDEFVASMTREKCYCDDFSRIAYEQTALHIAINQNHYDIAMLLLEKGANCHLEDNNGNTPLHLAVQYCPEIVPHLVCRIDKGSLDINVINEKGQTALDICSLLENNTQNRSNINFLRSHGAKSAEYMTRASQGSILNSFERMRSPIAVSSPNATAVVQLQNTNFLRSKL